MTLDEKKPSKFTAVMMTVGTLCSLIASLLLLAGGHTSGRLLAFQLLTSALLVALTIASWVVYFRKWVDCEIRSLEERATTNQ